MDPYQQAEAHIKQAESKRQTVTLAATADPPLHENPLRDPPSDGLGAHAASRNNPVRVADGTSPADSDGSAAGVARVQLTAGEDPHYAQVASAPSTPGPALVALNSPASNPSASSLSAGPSTPVTDRYASTSAPASPYAAAGTSADFGKLPNEMREAGTGCLSGRPLAAPANTVRRLPMTSDSLAANDEGTASDDGNGEPGDKQLEGPQSPQVSVEKSAPPEIQVGKPATLRVTVRNTGHVPAANVEIHDQIPRGTRLLGTTPHAARNARGELVWSVGTLKPGDESFVEMQLMPTAEGVTGSVASVRFDTDVSARSTVTRPRLAVTATGSQQVLIGEELKLMVTVSNPGSGVATGVVLEERVPAGLQHPAGAELEYPVGDLRPGESRKLELKLSARRPGPATNVLVARAEGNLKVEDRLNLQVLAPQLDLALVGPKRRYLEREACYQVSLSNPGTATAQQIDLVAYLPNGLKFLRANNAGQYDEAARAVHWRLQELPNNETGTVELVTMPVETGQQSLKLRATAQRGLTTEKEQPITIEGIAAVLFQVANDKNPVEVGGETTSEIRVVNRGSKAASNVRVAVLIPAEMKALSAEGPTHFVLDGNRVLFEGMARLAPKADAIYRVRLRGLQAGDVRVRCQLMTDEMQSPINKEEGVRVYADE